MLEANFAYPHSCVMGHIPAFFLLAFYTVGYWPNAMILELRVARIGLKSFDRQLYQPGSVDRHTIFRLGLVDRPTLQL